MSLSKSQIAKKIVSPGIVPRVKELFGEGFYFLAFLIAYLFSAVRLLPFNHPYLKNENYGRFGLWQVMAEAANYLQFSKKHIDKIVIYFTILTGFVLFILQVGLFVIALVNTPVQAQSAPAFTQFFNNPSEFQGTSLARGPEQDITFIMMDKVFGVPGVFESCVSKEIPCEDIDGVAYPRSIGDFPYPMHKALHATFAFYSYGVFFVSAVILLYFVVTIVGETAVTGSPFGQRFNKAFGPLRLVVFLALIIPLSNGLNAGQYLTLYAAKYGANFATNGWAMFAETLKRSTMAGTLIASPRAPLATETVRFIDIALTCREAEKLAFKDSIDISTHDAYSVWRKDGVNERIKIQDKTFKETHDANGNADIVIHFGYTIEGGEDVGDEHEGGVNPSCGILKMPVAGMVDDKSAALQTVYYDLIKDMIGGTSTESKLLFDMAECRLKGRFPGAVTRDCDIDYADNMRKLSTHYSQKLADDMNAEIQKLNINADLAIPDSLLEKGYGGAGMWYNFIAESNGRVSEAVMAEPQVFQFPAVIERVMQRQGAENEATDSSTIADPSNVDSLEAHERKIATVLSASYYGWDGIRKTGDKDYGVFIKAINLVLGTQGLFSMRENADINPLAQISALGKSMIDTTIRNLGVATLGAGLDLLFDGIVGDSAKAISGFIMSTFTVALLIGFVMFYVVPFLPFIYFFFAVSSWVKSIFEAMVAMPLWALAHVTRFDGEGLPGPAATNGYFLLLEIFLRPILTVVGLLASIVTFSAMIAVLNDIFDLIVNNVGGGEILDVAVSGTPSVLTMTAENMRGPLDQFLYTGMYAVIVYLGAMQSFKLIDIIPKEILRWAGQSIPAFQDDAGDPAGQMTGQVYQTSQIALNQLQASLSSNKKSAGQLANDAALAAINQ